MHTTAIPIILHINYCEQGQSYLDALSKAEQWGYDGVEFRGRCRRGGDRMQYLDSILEAFEDSGLNQLHFAINIDPSVHTEAALWEKELEEALQLIEKVGTAIPDPLFNGLSAPYVNPNGAPRIEYEHHGSAIATEEDWQKNVDFFKEVAKAAARVGGRIAFETHGVYLHDSVEASLQLVRRIGEANVGVNLDVANLYYFETPPDPVAILDQLGADLFYLHFKNLVRIEGVRDHTQCALSAGHINHRLLIQEAFKRGYRGPICLEAPRAGDREWFAQEDFAYIQALLEEV